MTRKSFSAMAVIANVYWNYSYAGECFNWTTQLPSSLGTFDGWGWQSCTEMVMPIGQYPTTDMLYPKPWSLQAAVERCQAPRAQGGQEVTPDPYAVLREYGGVHLEGASRILFTNGDLDPWSGGGVNASVLGGLYGVDNARGVVALLMEGAAHHLDLRGRNDSFDPESVQWVRRQQRLYLEAWIDGYDTPSAENVTAGLDTKSPLTPTHRQAVGQRGSADGPCHLCVSRPVVLCCVGGWC